MSGSSARVGYRIPPSVAMALNPVAYTENVVRSFLRYQLTAYPFADPGLHSQMRELLSLDQTRRSPLLKGPYVSLSRPFRDGAAVESLAAEGLMHPHLRERIPDNITHLHSHQEQAIRAIDQHIVALAQQRVPVRLQQFGLMKLHPAITPTFVPSFCDILPPLFRP